MGRKGGVLSRAGWWTTSMALALAEAIRGDWVEMLAWLGLAVLILGVSLAYLHSPLAGPDNSWPSRDPADYR